jgi:type VI secretion system secreted protein Hcp
MSIRYFLKMSGVEGESEIENHKHEIELSSWMWGASNLTTIEKGGMSAGRVSFTNLTFTKLVDKSSPKLLNLCATGKHADEATLACVKSTGAGTAEDFLTIKLETVFVSNYSTGGGVGGDVEQESITLNYGKINIDYKSQDKSGRLISAGSTGYDLIHGKAI